MVLDRSIAAMGTSPEQLLLATARYTMDWKPEVDAASWISERMVFQNLIHGLRAVVTALLGLSIFERAKSSSVPYSQVRRTARRWGPLWT